MIYKSWKKRDGCRTLTEVSNRNFGTGSTDAAAHWDDKFRRGLYHIHNLDRTAELLKGYIQDGYRFAIMGDYDADGITGSVILKKGLLSLGVDNKDAVIIIPDRIKDGYGAKPMHVDMVPWDEKVCLLFVDNGINCIDALERARERGFHVLILDHHTTSAKDAPELSESCVDPEAETFLYGEQLSDFDQYCGAGLAFSLMRKLISDGRTLNSLMCFAAIGTVCDVMPLREENFCIVKYGLRAIADKRYSPAGLYALTMAMNMERARLSAKDLGFSYGPVINAQSRMRGGEGVDDVLKLFLYEGDPARKIKAAERLIAANNDRKRDQNTGILVAERLIEEQGLKDSHPLVLYIPDINEGIVGIIAGKISEEFRTPAYVLTDADRDGLLKGSGRSYGNYDMADALESARPYLVSGGGHPGACGLSVEKSRLSRMVSALQENFPSDYVYEDTDTLYYDIEINARDIDRAVQCLTPMGPFGEGHEDIVFKIDGFRVIPHPSSVNILSDGDSFKLVGEKASAFGFKMKDAVPETMKTCDIIGTLSESYFLGRKSYRVEIIDIEDTSQEKRYVSTPLADRLKMMSAD